MDTSELEDFLLQDMMSSHIDGWGAVQDPHAPQVNGLEQENERGRERWGVDKLPSADMLATLDFSSSIAFAFPLTSSFATPHSASSEGHDLSTPVLPHTTSFVPSAPPVPSASTPRSTELPPDIAREAQRRLKQNLASQEYRRRKRRQMANLENTVATLTQQLTQAKQDLLRLQSSESQLDCATSIYQVCAEGQRIVSFIEVAQQEQRNEADIACLLDLFWSNVELLLAYGQDGLDKTIDPFMLRTLLFFGFGVVTHESPSTRLIPAAPWWPAFCIQEALSLSQVTAIENIKCSTQQAESALFRERMALSDGIRTTQLKIDERISPHHVNFGMTSTGSEPDTLDVALMTDLKEKIDSLRTNFATQYRSLLSAHRQIGAVLTVRQHAKLVIRAFSGKKRRFDESMESIRAAWKLLSST